MAGAATFNKVSSIARRPRKVGVARLRFSHLQPTSIVCPLFPPVVRCLALTRAGHFAQRKVSEPLLLLYLTSVNTSRRGNLKSVAAPRCCNRKYFVMRCGFCRKY